MCLRAGTTCYDTQGMILVQLSSQGYAMKVINTSALTCLIVFVLAITGCNSQPTPINTANLQPNVTYQYDKDGGCRNEPQHICINEQSYQQLCTTAVGISNGALISLAYEATDPIAKAALHVDRMMELSDKIRATDVSWQRDANGSTCRVKIDVLTKEGAKPAKMQITAQASGFRLGGDNDLLVSYMRPDNVSVRQIDLSKK